jgi:chromosome segregation ATPase
MVTLDQIQNLEVKVQRAVAYIAELKEKNVLLQKNLEKSRKRIDDLEVLINEYKEDQNEIEQGLINALTHLDKLEDDIIRPPAAEASPEIPAAGQKEESPEIDDIEAAVVQASDGDDEDENDDAEQPKDAASGGKGELDIF